MMALSADSDEKHEPAGDIDTVAVDSLKALDPNRPIREADILCYGWMCGLIRYMALEITSDKTLYRRQRLTSDKRRYRNQTTNITRCLVSVVT